MLLSPGILLPRPPRVWGSAHSSSSERTGTNMQAPAAVDTFGGFSKG